MREATVRSRCECQSLLVAILNEEHLVCTAFVQGIDGERELAPAHTIGSVGGEFFDIGWLCPVCGRNTLRSFASSSLSWRDGPAPAASSTG